TWGRNDLNLFSNFQWVCCLGFFVELLTRTRAPRVCNNSPAESTSPENGWRLSERPIPSRCWLRLAATSRRVVAVASKALGVGPAGASVSADLGGSSKYLSSILED
ncbi:hypothetical protein COOONC_18170, partial [Cooperia oncophora]